MNSLHRITHSFASRVILQCELIHSTWCSLPVRVTIVIFCIYCIVRPKQIMWFWFPDPHTDFGAYPKVFMANISQRKLKNLHSSEDCIKIMGSYSKFNIHLAGPARSVGCAVRLVFRSPVRSLVWPQTFIEIWSWNNFNRFGSLTFFFNNQICWKRM